MQNYGGDILTKQLQATKSKLFFMAFIIFLSGFAHGALMAYYVIAIPYFTDRNIFTMEEVSWCASLLPPFKLVGTLLSAWAQDRIGRKKTIIISNLAMVMTAIALYFSNSFSSLMIATFINGFSTGMSDPTSFALLSEIALIKYRGVFSSTYIMTINVGYLFALFLGPLVSFDIFPLILALPSTLSICLVWFLVESPLWFLTKNRKPEAVETLILLRGPAYQLDQEIQELEDSLAVEKTSLTDILKSGFWPSSIMFLLAFFQTSNGNETISTYSLVIFSDFVISKHTFSLMFQVMITLGYLLSPVIMLNMNRKPQLVAASILMAIGLVLAGAPQLLPAELQATAPLIGVIIAGLSYGLGGGPVIFALMSEIFPQKLKSTGLALSLCARALFTFVNLKIFPFLRSLAGMDNIFFLHAAVLVVCALFTMLFVPETKDLSIQQLESIHENNNKKEQGKNNQQLESNL